MNRGTEPFVAIELGREPFAESIRAVLATDVAMIGGNAAFRTGSPR
jgi:hypothetical protein